MQSGPQALAERPHAAPQGETHRGLQAEAPEVQPITQTAPGIMGAFDKAACEISPEDANCCDADLGVTFGPSSCSAELLFHSAIRRLTAAGSKTLSQPNETKALLTSPRPNFPLTPQTGPVPQLLPQFHADGPQRGAVFRGVREALLDARLEVLQGPRHERSGVGREVRIWAVRLSQWIFWIVVFGDVEPERGPDVALKVPETAPETQYWHKKLPPEWVGMRRNCDKEGAHDYKFTMGSCIEVGWVFFTLPRSWHERLATSSVNSEGREIYE